MTEHCQFPFDYCRAPAYVDLSFLEEGEYHAVLAQDGINADRYPSDYTITERTLNKTSAWRITMAKGGGFLVVLKMKE